MTQNELLEWIDHKTIKIQTEISALPLDPTPSALQRYHNLTVRLDKLGEIKARFTRSRKTNPEGEGPLY